MATHESARRRRVGFGLTPDRLQRPAKTLQRYNAGCRPRNRLCTRESRRRIPLWSPRSLPSVKQECRPVPSAGPSRCTTPPSAGSFRQSSRGGSRAPWRVSVHRLAPAAFSRQHLHRYPSSIAIKVAASASPGAWQRIRSVLITPITNYQRGTGRQRDRARGGVQHRVGDVAGDRHRGRHDQPRPEKPCGTASSGTQNCYQARRRRSSAWSSRKQ